MNISKTANKLVSNVSKNADTLGLIYALVQDPIGDGRGLSGAPNFMIDRISNWKIPTDINTYLHYLKHDPKYNGPLKTALMAYLAGFGAELIGQKKFSKPLKDAAVGMVKGTALAAALWLPAINPHGSTTTKNFANAPTLSQYQY